MRKAVAYLVRVLILLGVLCPAVAVASGLFIEPCGPPAVNYASPAVPVSACFSDVSDRLTPAGTGAATNFTHRENIGPVRYGSETSTDWTTATTFTRLELDGPGSCVNPGPSGCAGELQVFGPGTPADIGFLRVVEQFTFPIVLKTLTITLSGNATHNVEGSLELSDPPEPSTLAFSGVSFLICTPWIIFRRKRFER
jgi:hypothetical protein